jgi:hypothetical protein
MTTPERLTFVFAAGKGSATRRRVARERVVGKRVQHYSPLPIAARDDRLIAERLSHALRYPHTEDTVVIGVEVAQALLGPRIEPSGGGGERRA